METIDQAYLVAIDAAARAGELARNRWSGELDVRSKGASGDVVTRLDHEAEQVIVDRIRHSFPDHRIIAEERGEVPGADEWLWLVDPIDGTNNLALGLPLFGVCITLCHDKIPVVAAIHSGHRGVTYAAMRGSGATVDGGGVTRIPKPQRPGRATVSWIQGYGVEHDDAKAHAALDGLSRHFKRTLQFWAPSIDWSLLVEGKTSAVIAYKNELDDLVGGLLIASEAGAVITDFYGNEVVDFEDVTEIIAAAPDSIDDVVQALRDASSIIR